MKLVSVAITLPLAAVGLRAAIRSAQLGGIRAPEGNAGGPAEAERARARSRLSRPFEHVRRARRARAVAHELPMFLDALARALRSGLSTEAAVRDCATVVTGPLRDDVGSALRSVELGLPLDESLERWRRSSSDPGVGLATTALALGTATGGAQAQAVDAVATTLRERLALQAEVRSLGAQARASAVVMAVTPVIFLTIAAAVDPASAWFLVTTRFGLACLFGGLFLDAVGALWMISLTRSVR